MVQSLDASSLFFFGGYKVHNNLLFCIDRTAPVWSACINELSSPSLPTAFGNKPKIHNAKFQFTTFTCVFRTARPLTFSSRPGTARAQAQHRLPAPAQQVTPFFGCWKRRLMLLFFTWSSLFLASREYRKCEIPISIHTE